MRLLDSLRRRGHKADRDQTAEPASVPTGGFTVIDVETTGLSAKQHRVLEIAVVRTDTRGRITGEWARRLDPEGPVGATHIHGITADDVRGAPKFAELIPHLNSWLAGTVVVAHNARFDLAFLRAEYTYAGWALPRLPALCTLEASSYYLPDMDRRRLADCCSAARIPLRGAHSALGDARATAGLLAHYLDPRTGVQPHPEHLHLIGQAAAVRWPTEATGRPQTPQSMTVIERRRTIAMSTPKPQTQNLVELLAGFSLIDALDEGAPPASMAYLETLAEALEDGEITDDETQALNDLAAAHDLSDDDRANANRAILLALSHIALEDGLVSRAEKAELLAVSEMLQLPRTVVTRSLDQAEAARHERLSANLRPLPADWTHGEPLRVGHKVVFTGCDETLRMRLENQAEKLGVRVVNSVSSKTAMLITDGGFSGTKAAAAQAAGTRVVHPDVFAFMLRHLQPAEPRTRPKSATSFAPAPPSADDAPKTSMADPAIVRQWARDNGYAVGTRGRMPRELFAAYAAAAEA